MTFSAVKNGGARVNKCMERGSTIYERKQAAWSGFDKTMEPSPIKIRTITFHTIVHHTKNNAAKEW